MKKIGPTLLLALFATIPTGCSLTSWWNSKGPVAPQVKIDQMEPVIGGGNAQAVLSLHKRYAYADACTFGLTLTNNLPYAITNIRFRFTAFTKNDVSHQQVTRNFVEIDPARRQYREIDFSGITCEAIDHIEVSDPGRCAMGELTRFASQPGDCIRQVHIAESPYVRLVQK